VTDALFKSVAKNGWLCGGCKIAITFLVVFTSKNQAKILQMQNQLSLIKIIFVLLHHTEIICNRQRRNKSQLFL